MLPTKPLDAAAAAAYGGAADTSESKLLRETLALNGGARYASCDAVRSVDGFGGSVDSSVKSGERRGNDGRSVDSKLLIMTDLLELCD